MTAAANLQRAREEFERAADAKANAVRQLDEANEAAKLAMSRRDAADWVYRLTAKFESGINNFAIPSYFDNEQIDFVLKLIETQPEKTALKLHWDCWTCGNTVELVGGVVDATRCAHRK